MGKELQAQEVEENVAIVSSKGITVDGMVMLEEFKTIPQEAIRGNEHRLVCINSHQNRPRHWNCGKRRAYCM